MLKKIFAVLLALLAAAAFAAVDVNKASQAELESVKGIGPALSQRLLDERKKGAFKDWPDVIERVKGIGSGNAARFSTGGLTVNGSAYAGAPAAAPAAGGKATTGSGRPAAPASAAAATGPVDKPMAGRAASGGDRASRKDVDAASASAPRPASASAPAAPAAKAGAKP